MMEKVIWATYDGKHLTTEAGVDVPPDTHLKVIIDTEESLQKGGDGALIKDLPQQRNAELLRLLRSWRENGDQDEQRETWEYLKQALDEDRLSDRKLF